LKIIKKIYLNVDLNSSDLNLDFLPCKSYNGLCEKQLYLSIHHAVKINGVWIDPLSAGFIKCNIDEFISKGVNIIKYYHLKLESKDGENRRINTLIANGLEVESYSNEKL